MKRYGNLFAKVVAEENISMAYERAKKSKAWQNSVKDVEAHKEERLADLRQSLINHSFTTSTYRQKKIYEPKARIIHILPFYPDRIIQHAIIGVLEPIWDSFFIKDSYACRKGKGQHAASLRCMEFVKRNPHVLQIDVAKFYPSINHDVLKEIIAHKTKDKEMLWLLYDIIDSIDGVPIGNYTSQWFGNLYLNELDKLVKEVWHIGDYERYCDDALIFGDKARLREIAPQIEDFMQSRLKMRLSKCELYPTSHGVDFLGYRHFPSGKILLRKTTVKRVQQRIKEMPYLLEHGEISVERARSSLASTRGWMQWANTYNLTVSLKLQEMEALIEAYGKIQRLRQRASA